MNHDSPESRLDRLWESYRDACPDVEPSAGFMPQLWQKIEARQSTPWLMRRFTRVVVSMSMAACLAMSVFLVAPMSQGPAFLISYVEALDDEQPAEALTYADVDPDHDGDPAWQ